MKEKIRKIVQGSYITLEARDALKREAGRKKILTTRLVSEIIEVAAEKIIRKELEENANTERKYSD